MTTDEAGGGIVPGLTTTRAAFIEEAISRGDMFIHQPYEQYSEENQETWRRLYSAIEPKWHEYAHPRFLEGLDMLALNPERIPRLEEINRFLEPLSAFKTKAVSGYVAVFLFFATVLPNRYDAGQKMGAHGEDKAAVVAAVAECLQSHGRRKRIQPLTSVFLGNRKTLQPHFATLEPQVVRENLLPVPLPYTLVQFFPGKTNNRFA